MKNKIIQLVLVAVVVGGIAFYAGLKQGQGTGATSAQTASGNFANLTPEERQARAAQMGEGRGGNAGASVRTGGGLTAGEIISVDEGSVTVKMRDGNSRIVFWNTKTPLVKNIAGSASDLKIGTQVIITGSPNSNGSFNAISIQIDPSTRAF